MKRLVACALVLGPLLFCAPLRAEPEDAADLAHQLVERSGLAVQLRGIAPQVEAQVLLQRGSIEASVLASVSSAAREAFRPETLQQEIERTLAAGLGAADTRKTLAWLDSAPGKRVTRAEEQSALPDEASMNRFVAAMKAKPPSARRIKLINDTIAASGSYELYAKTMEEMAFGVMVGMDSAQPVEKRRGGKRLRSDLRKAMPPETTKQKLQEALPGLFAYTYRDISDDALQGYVTFLRSPAGRRYSRASYDAYARAMVAASLRMGQLVDTSYSKRPA